MRKIKRDISQHSFSIEAAVKYGKDEAIVLRYIAGHIEHNEDHQKHQFDGYTWVYFTPKGLTKTFPYFTERQIRRLLESLRKRKILKTGNYNQTAYDRTLWYTICDKNFYANARIHLHNRVNGLAPERAPIPHKEHVKNSKKENYKEKFDGESADRAAMRKKLPRETF